ncbi:RNA-binding cell elongation regulator Jag/EloR [Paenibacillus sacheonensis]|uniref:RNA-binding protein KhpB n=1 Tax=Paenibacillus sacheonensis TaxID=742054 RepID=A0A7X5C2X7_9BACL|nr:RNA-binding cell elongation regulator Jag/EloR [Paenibacillus sacheonensis]MBM7567949.1 spoIIIJ-associated protein [Paenibacillus sacheonensis]NBC70834.1 KH domain-containing protein [Paenibacillus sacheonensis]
MKKIVASGKTIEDAVKSGLTELQVSAERVSVTVLEKPSKGLFGLIGVRAAKVELMLKPVPNQAAEAEPLVQTASVAAVDKSTAPAKDAILETERFIIEVARTMGLDITIARNDSKDGLVLALSGGGDLGMLIGRRGQTLDALQYLVNIVANRYSNSHLRIVLDAEDFRERRRKTLEDLSDRLAGHVIRTRKEVVLEPMAPHERKIIHSQLQNHAKVKTFSKGDEPNRRVVITLKS